MNEKFFNLPQKNNPALRTHSKQGCFFIFEENAKVRFPAHSRLNH